VAKRLSRTPLAALSILRSHGPDSTQSGSPPYRRLVSDEQKILVAARAFISSEVKTYLLDSLKTINVAG
jgi:hypothetical protein